MNIPLPTEFDRPLRLLSLLKKYPESFWIQKGEQRVLQLFKQMSQYVPAYRDFLKKQKVDPKKINTIADFKQIPPIDKNNYLRFYPRKALCWGGQFEKSAWVIASTSGSTGEPYYFPRRSFQDRQYALTAELYLRSNFQIHKKSTLYIIGFPMGVWIGGLFTYEALRQVADRGNYPLSIIAPGINKLEIIKAVKNLGENFEQIIIGSYGPFLKDILDDGVRQGVDWKKYHLKFVFSAEGFSEEFRDYVLKISGAENVYLDTLNHYGTVDLGTMSHETPLAIFIRRKALISAKLYADLFRNVSKLPTLTQYNPEHFYFESIQGNLYCSAYSGIPLVRYDLKDHGGIIGFTEVYEAFRQNGLDLIRESAQAKISDTIWNLPFAYVYERSDFSVSFFAFQIYPETIRKALQRKVFEEEITGKFTMQVAYNKQSDQQFEIHIELKANKKKSGPLIDKIRRAVVELLTQENSEYRKTREEFGRKTDPQIILWPYEHALYFKPGIKQKWVKKINYE